MKLIHMPRVLILSVWCVVHTLNPNLIHLPILLVSLRPHARQPTEPNALMAPLPAEPPRDAAAAAAAACLLSSALRPFPSFFLPLPTQGQALDRAPSLATADRLVRSLATAASEIPFLRPLFSLHSHLHSFSQARRREVRPLPAHGFAAILPGDSVAGLVVANGITNFLNIYNSLLVVRLVLTWFPNSPPAIVSPLSTLCDPYLNIFRGIIPPLGGTLDLSPILAFLVLNVFTSTAAALPAELPVVSNIDSNLSRSMPLHLTMTQEKWMRRVWCNRAKNPGNNE